MQKIKEKAENQLKEGRRPTSIIKNTMNLQNLTLYT